MAIQPEQLPGFKLFQRQAPVGFIAGCKRHTAQHCMKHTTCSEISSEHIVHTLGKPPSGRWNILFEAVFAALACLGDGWHTPVVTPNCLGAGENG
eukprot:6042572-Amphidinium_carterae.1